MHMEKQIGAAIRRIRKSRGITLQTLAQRSGLSKGYLSKVEHGLKAPPVSTLSRIARAMGVEMADFFERESSEPRFTLVRRDERHPISRDGSIYGYLYESIAHPYGRKLMEPFILTFVPNPKDKSTFSHEGEELIYVLEGRMRFFYGDREYICEEGDCLYFDSSVSHRGDSLGDRETKVLIVMAAGRSSEQQ